MKAEGDIAGVFFCAGARNNLLLERLAHLPIHFETDERIASYKAIGLSKATGKMTIICTTSGTAVSECLSALIEAYHSSTPVLLISADRPAKLNGSGAPQTIDHEIITRGYRKAYKDITFEEFEDFDCSLIEYPAHLNVRITTADEQGSRTTTREPRNFTEFMASVKNPLYIFSHDKTDMRRLVQKFIHTGRTFYAEVTSGAKDLSLIQTEKKLLNLYREGVFDGIVRIGHTPLTKLWRILEGSNLPVYSFDSRGLKALSHGTVESKSSEELIQDDLFWSAIPPKQNTVEDETVEKLHQLCEKFPESEVAVMKRLHDCLHEKANVFLGNSLPIRYFELVQKKPFTILANRGVNGIDGQLATARGWALANLKNQVYCILGDQSFSYDLSSLQGLEHNLKCIIINNDGGRIFEHLGMDQRMIMKHGKNYKSICEGLGLKYSTDLRDLQDCQVLELFPSNQASRDFLKEWST